MFGGVYYDERALKRLASARMLGVGVLPLGFSAFIKNSLHKSDLKMVSYFDNSNRYAGNIEAKYE